jgi:UDP-N-acetylmuramoyl-tripeptide--D-alanyl-D-alanine ligase
MRAASAGGIDMSFALNVLDVVQATAGVGRGDAHVTSLSTDTRTLMPRALYVALRGPNFDGHAFVREALAKGAAAVVVDHAMPEAIPQIVVADTRLALGQVGRYWRGRTKAIVLGVTGSNGKTTTKEMLAAMLAQAGKTFATQGNFNNDIGVPLMLAKIEDDTRYAVIEMGASHVGEIAYLASLARPVIGLITNAGPAHLEGFGSLDGVARGKGEMFEFVSANGGTCVLNMEDAYASYWRKRMMNCNVITYGFNDLADVRAARADESNAWIFHTPRGEMTTEMPLPGRHNVMNALAACAAASAAGLDCVPMQAGLEQLKSVKGRLVTRVGCRGAVIIDDTYNANLASFKAGLAVLSEKRGRHWVVLGDMGELGVDAPSIHAQAGIAAKAVGVERLFALGPLSRHAADSFGVGAMHFDAVEALNAALNADLDEGVTVLIKGSRSMRMERVVAAVTVATPEAEA